MQHSAALLLLFALSCAAAFELHLRFSFARSSVSFFASGGVPAAASASPLLLPLSFSGPLSSSFRLQLAPLPTQPPFYLFFCSR